MRFFIASAMVLLGLFSTPLSAKEITVFAVNFSKPDLQQIVQGELEKRVNTPGSVIGILDAGSSKFVGYFSSDHPEFGNEGASRGIKSELTSRFATAKDTINLPLISSEVNEFILAHFKENDTVNIYLVDVLEHHGRNFVFGNGFPNDGFLTLDDSDFSLIERLPETFQSRVFVAQLTDNGFGDQYLRFAYHLSKMVFGGELSSFAFASSAPPLGFDEPVTENITDLEVVSASCVVNDEERPICEVEDLVQVIQKAERLDISLRNLSRANSVGNYLLKVGASMDEGQFTFDSEGNGSFSVKRIPGDGVLSVSDCAGSMQEHYSYDVDELDDVISVVGVSDGTARISGENVQRIDGSDVVIFDETTGRRWVTQVAGGQYSMDIPIAPGKHNFYVERPFSKGKQYFTVQLQENCTLSSNFSYGGAVGRMKVQSTCSIEEVLTLSYGGKNYSERFSSSQVAEVEFPLSCGTTYGVWKVDQRPENEFVVQYAISPDQVSATEGNSAVSIKIKNPSRANGKAKYRAVMGSNVFEGNITFSDIGVAVIELDRKTPGTGIFHLEDCQGNLVQAGTYKVTDIDDDIVVTVLSNTKARIIGKNIQRMDGSRVTIKNEDTGEEWATVVQDGQYKLDVIAPPGLQNFSATKPSTSGKYPFTIKVRDECKIQDEVSYDEGIAVLKLKSDCNDSGQVTVSYDDREDYKNRFNDAGVVEFRPPMNCGETIGRWKSETDAREFTTVLDCTGKVRVILSWSEPVDLDLHVAEGRNANHSSGVNWAYFGKCLGPNNADCKAVGFINKDCQSSSSDGCGSPKEEYYEVDMQSLPASAKSITVMVNNYTRDNSGKPAMPHCGNGEYATVSYSLTAYIEGERYERRGVREHRKRFARVPCDVNRSKAAFIQENELTIPLR